MKSIILIAVLLVAYVGALDGNDVSKLNPACGVFALWKNRLNYFKYGPHI